jgi:hypothetical protein
MNLYKYFGVNTDYFQNIEKPEANRQILIYNILAVMVLILAALVSLSILIFTLLIFQSWILGIILMIFAFIVIWNLYNLIIVISLVPSNNELYNQWINFEKYLEKYIGPEHEELSNLEINNIVQQNKEILRKSKKRKTRYKPSLSLFFKDLMILSVIVILALLTANAIQLFIFSDNINLLLAELNTNLVATDSSMNIIFKEDPERPFVILNSYSILIDLEILLRAMGNWKYISDTFFIILFFLPYVVIKKSEEIRDGAYLRENVLHEISINFTSELLTRKKIKEIEFELSHNWDEEKYHSFIVNNKS